MPGPPPTPTAILRRRGSWRADTRKSEPTNIGKWKAPKGMDKLTAEVWRRIVARLKRLEVGGEVDTELLLEFCKAVAEAVEVDQILAKEGKFVKVGEQPSEPHPLLKRRDKLREAIYRLSQQFGFSPASRTKVHKEESIEESDPLKAFLPEGA